MSEKSENTSLLDDRGKRGVSFSMKLEDIVKKIGETDEQDKKEKMDTRRNEEGWDRRKLYEVMLMEEIPEEKRPNAPTYAVLDSQLGKWKIDGKDTNNVRNHALLHYLANLANSNNRDDVFNFEFVESLVRSGADINCMDTNGQTIFHEVARSWNVDVALFLVEHGANVNHQDEYGRSPLHVAAAVDYADMVEFILQNGGDIHIKTKGEEQTAIHYAAKNDAVNSIQMLLGHRANIDARDSRNRTPLQVAAEMNSFKAAKLLVTEGAPAGVYDDHGNSALSLLIEKIPEVALIALDQLHTTDYINRREFYFLNYLEGAKVKEELQDTPARSPLEIAVQNERFDVIMHPVMRRLIAVKWKIYGKRGAIMDLVLNLMYTILWTVEGVTMPRHGYELYHPPEENIWRLIISGILILCTLMEIKKQVTKTIVARRQLVKWRESRAEQLQQDKEYCHPRWRQEEKYLKSEIDAVQSLSLVSTSDWWIYFDWACLFLILAAIAAKILFFKFDGIDSHKIAWKEISMYTTIAMLLILWFRMFKYARPFESAGPYVVIFSNVVGDILKWIVLNAAIIIPFACAFWIGFGYNSTHPAKGYTDASSLLYNVFQMMIVGDYGWANLQKANETMARILCGSFILTAAIITLNLLIALVTNTFERHYENAIANAVMQRAQTILLLQSRMGSKNLKHYYNFIKSNASPQIIQNRYGRLMANKPEDRATIERVYDDVRQIKSVLAERFGKRYGKGNKSDLEIVREDLGKVKKSGMELAKDVNNLKLILYGMGGEPVSPVRKSAEDRNSIANLLSDRKGEVSTALNKEASNMKHNKENVNDTTSNNNNGNKKPVNNDTNDNLQPDHDTMSNQQKELQNNQPLIPSAFLQSYLDKLSLPQSSKKRNRGRRPSKKLETSCTESSESDDAYVPEDKQKFSPGKAIHEKQRRKSDLKDKRLRGNARQWWTGDYDEQSTSGSRNDVPLRYVQPTSEPVYIDPQFSNPEIHVLTYPSKPNIRHGTSTPLMPHMAPTTPYYPSLTPVVPSKGYLPSVQPGIMEHFPHRYSTPSEDLNHAFVPLRRISGASVGQQVMPGYTMMHVPQTGHDSLHSSPGLRRRQSEYSSLLHAGTMPAQSLPKNEVYVEGESVLPNRQEEPKSASNLASEQTVTEAPHTVQDGGDTEAPQSQRTIWTKDETKDLNV